MNRVYVVKMGSREFRGLISPGEMLDVVTVFYHHAERYSAKADFLLSGELVATKGEVTVSLMVGAPCLTMPSRLLEEVLEEVMEKAFQ